MIGKAAASEYAAALKNKLFKDIYCRQFNMSSASTRLRCFTTLAATFMLSPLPAQSTGIISGTLSDETRAVLPGVTVEATHAATGTTRSAVTGADGHYRLVGLTLGEYEVRASLTGFQTAVSTGLTVDIGREVVVNLVLRIGEINQEVIVEVGAALVQTTSAAVSGLVDRSRYRTCL